MRLSVNGIPHNDRRIIEQADKQNAKLNRDNYFNGDVYIPDGSGGHDKVTVGGGIGDMTKDVYDTDDDGKVGAAVIADSASAVAWSNVTGKPSTFTPSSHTHPISEITSLQTTLDAKAPLASPALTGSPTAPTQTGGDNSTKIATTAYVDAAGGGGEANITPEYASVYEAGTTSLSTSDTVLDLDTERTSSTNMSLASSVVTYGGTESPVVHIHGWVTINSLGDTRLGLIMEIQHKPDGGSWSVIAEAMGYARQAANAGGVSCSAIISAGENDQFRIVAKTSASTATTQADRSGMTIMRFG